ncbi:MAG: D-alanyl-D-alanine carboxypeptidase/D-alanyl-D-alanine-endopeptidase [Candidatus Glassbacteria bacterium]|nr:D-alanyl-D-alanine carboxypeptidase/D-alanyl-D-alanine-endopeptidase [Candidatus Glassbacteria bacterium]
MEKRLSVEGSAARVFLSFSYPVRAVLPVLMTVLLFLSLPVPALGGREPDRELTRRILSTLESYHQDPADWGVQVRSLERGDDLVSLNSRRRFMPASNLKLLVTAAALDGLGADFRYHTTVMAAGEISAPDSTLRGDLVLRGSGDPTISDRFYPAVDYVWDQLAGQVCAAGIRRVTGALVADNTLFVPPRRADGWSWEDLMWYYAAPVSAISYNDNCIDLEVLPAKAGQPPELRIKPEGATLRLVNRAATVASRAEDRLVITRDSPGGRVVVDGGIYYRSLGFLEHVSVESPALYATEAFARALARRGVRIDGPVRVLESPVDSTRYLDNAPLIVAQHFSVPLEQIVRVINKRSHNFYAEQLLFTLGACLGREGSFQGGLEVEKRFLRKLGLDTGTLRIEDGSGLSRLNLVTTEMFIGVLARMDKHPLRENYVSSLPVGGIDNGVRLMRKTAADGRLFAKTGYISAVMALSGYAQTADEEPVAFSIMGNNWVISRREAQRLIRDICLAIAGFSRGTPPVEEAGVSR